MRGPKLNEGATYAQMAAGERHGTKASATSRPLVGLARPGSCSIWSAVST